MSNLVRTGSGAARVRMAAAAAALALAAAAPAMADVTFTPPAGMTPAGAGQISVREVLYGGDDNGTVASGGLGLTIGDQDAARAALTNPAAGARIYNYTTPHINVQDNGGGGHFSGASEQRFAAATGAGGAGVGNVNHLAVVYHGAVQIPSTGAYTFGVNSDDGFTLAIDGGNSAFTSATNASVEKYNGHDAGAIQFFTGRAAADSFGQINLAAGVHTFTLTYHEGGGGSAIEFLSAPGTKTAFDGSFGIVGKPGETTIRRSGIVTGGWNAKAVHGNNSGNLTDAIADIQAAFQGQTPVARGGGTPVVDGANLPTIAVIDPQNGNTGGHGSTANYPGDGSGDDNNFSFGARATLTIPAGEQGHYSFLVYSDDSALFRIRNTSTNAYVPLLGTTNANAVDSDGIGGNETVTNDGACCADFIGRYDLAAGNYQIETISNEQGGGAGHFVYGAFGDQTSFDPGLFQLVGENIDQTSSIPDGLQVVAAPEPGTAALLAVGAAAALGRRRRRRR